MLTTGFGDFDAAELSFVSQYTYIFETLGTNQLRIVFVLGEQRDVFRQRFLCRIIPVVKVCMGDDDCVDTRDNLVRGFG